MAFLKPSEIKDLYHRSVQEKVQWQSSYPTYERLMDNDLMDGLDPNLPEVNDGSLAAALFKLPKRVVSDKLSGTVKALDRDEKWLSELANLIWRNKIMPNAKTQAPFIRKLKDSVRKAAGYGSVPLITIYVEKEEGECTTDFIVAPPQDVTLETGKVSDMDSQVIFWDVFFSESELKNMIEQAESENKEGTGYSKWNTAKLKEILKSKQTEQQSPLNTHTGDSAKSAPRSGFRFVVAFQRGKDAPFYMFHSEHLDEPDVLREWTNPDPTGDIPVHYLYCYQDFKNPYGIGIVKLAGGTQNVLDYMRQADVLGTQIGLRPPIKIQGNRNEVDEDSLVYAQDAIWYVGEAEAERQELSDGIYTQLPERIAMYKTSLNQLIPTGDTSIGSAAGDPQYSKTHAGVKFQAANLSIDDDDFRDNLNITYAAVVQSIINTHFANMEGRDLMKLTDEELDLLIQAGFPIEPDERGYVSNEIDIIWDQTRAKFNFTVDPELDKTQDDQQKLEGLSTVAEIIKDPTNAPLLTGQPLIIGTKKINPGELLAEIVSLSTDNDKIVSDATPDEIAAHQQMMAQQAQAAMGAEEPAAQLPGETVTFKDAVEAGATEAAATILEEVGLPANDLRTKGSLKEQQQAAAMKAEKSKPVAKK